MIHLNTINYPLNTQMISINKSISIEEFFKRDNLTYTRVNSFNSKWVERDKVRWYYEADEGLMPVRRDLFEVLESEYREGVLRVDKKRTDVEDLVLYNNVEYLRCYSNWPREKTVWMAQDNEIEEMVKDNIEVTEGKREVNIKIDAWSDAFFNPDLPMILETAFKELDA